MRCIETVLVICSLVMMVASALTGTPGFAVIGACGMILCAGHAPALPYERPSTKFKEDE